MTLTARLRPSLTQPNGLLARLRSVQDALAYVAPEPVTVPFGDWLPDLPDLGNPGALQARNVIPRIRSYGSLGALTAATGALTTRARGGTLARDSSGNNYNYAGDTAKLYEVRASGVTDKSGAAYATADDDVWEFTPFGTQLMATNLTDAVQEITIGEAGNFADLITSTLTPKARHIATVREFLVLGHTNDATDGLVPERIWWSGFRDATDFDPAQATQCDYEDRLDGGWIQRVVGGTEYGLVFQQTAILRMSYAGLPAIFQFDKIDKARGTPVPNAVVSWGRRVFFPSEEGFYFNDGTQSYPIGEEQVDRRFWSEFDINNAHLVSASVDPLNSLVAWAYPASGSDLPNRILFYNWMAKRWADADVELDSLVQGTSEAFTLEDIDTVALDSGADTTISVNEASGQTILSVTDETGFEAGDTVRITLNSGSIDQTTVASTGVGTITVDDALTGAADAGNRVVRTSIDAPGLASLDSSVWGGGGVLFGAYDRDHKLGYFDGDNLTATIDTGEFEMNPNGSARLAEVRPIVDGGTVTVSVAGRNTQQEAVVFDPAIAIDSEGSADPDNEARYHRLRVSVSGNWSHAQGVKVIGGKAGDR